MLLSLMSESDLTSSTYSNNELYHHLSLGKYLQVHQKQSFCTKCGHNALVHLTQGEQTWLVLWCTTMRVCIGVKYVGLAKVLVSPSRVHML